MVKELVTRHYDFKMGLIGAIVMGAAVYWINAEHGFWAAIPAALKQAVYTVVAGGFLTRICERLALKFNGEFIAHFLAMLVPSAIAVLLTLGVHYMKGTPEPFNSTIPTIFLAPVSFLLWGWHIRRRHWKPEPEVADVAVAVEEGGLAAEANSV